MIKLSCYVMKYIAGLGVRHVFMLSGGGCMHLVDSLGKNPSLQYVANLHEQACAIAADAYSQYTENLGVALVTTGPGATNAITGVCASWVDSIPVLVISGQVKRADLMDGTGLRQMGPQEVDIISMVRPITKYAERIMDPETIKFHLQKAVYLAKSGRPGPVWLDIPLDVQGAMIEETALDEFIPPEEKPAEDMSEKIEEIISLFNQAERPVVLAGNGIRLAKAKSEFLELMATLKVPVLTTWKAIDLLPEDHPYYFGRPGSIGQRGANFIQQNADFLMTIGARLDKPQVAFNYKNFAREAYKVIVDIDEAEIHKMDTEIAVAIAADAKSFLEKLLSCKDQLLPKGETPWLKRCREWKERYPVVLPEYRNQKDFVNTYVLVDELSEALTNNDLLVPGSSASCSEITLQAFKVKEGQRILNSPGLGSMGFGLAASIGACFAGGKRRTVCLIGDGGLQHNIQELELLTRYRLPIKLFVLNNNGYASIRTTQRNHFKGHLVGSDPASGVTLPDTIKIAKSYGIRTERIENHAQIGEKIQEVLSGDDPVVCEVMVDVEMVTAPRVTSEVKPDGRIVSKPMEDLWPFLDREEFKANMMVKPFEE